MTEITGINIYTKSNDWLGRALTNPSYAKNDKSEYDIHPLMANPITKSGWIKPEEFILPANGLFRWAINKYGNRATAKNAWGYSVESWYFANTFNLKYDQNSKELIMYDLIRTKFNKYKQLIVEINKRGGLEFLEKCSHIVSGNKNWEGIGYKSNFIKILIFSYRSVTNRENFYDKILNQGKGLF